MTSVERPQYQAIVDTAIDCIVVIDEQGIIQSFNPAAEQTFGYSSDEVIGKNVKLLMPQPHHDRHDEYLSNYRQTGVAKIIGIGREVQGRHKDGSGIPLDLTIAEWASKGRRYFTGIMRDITERKATEERSRSAEARYRAIVDTAVDAISVIDTKGIVQAFNASAERMFGFRAKEVIGHNIKMLMPEPYRREHDSYLSNYMQTGIARIIGTGREVEGCRKDGTLFPIELSITEWTSNQQRYFTGIMRDISDRKQAEQETLQAREALERLNRNLEERVRQEVATREAAQVRAAQAERMQALGQLAGGIAHDFNNVLQAVWGAADSLQMQAGEPEVVARVARIIVSAAERGASVTERLLAFARRSNLRAEPLDVARTLHDLGRLLAQTLGVSITVRVEIEAALPPLMADKGQLETVLINLATNARDAMPGGGVLTLSAANMVVLRNERETTGFAPGRYIRIVATDTGIGMDATTLVRATEPFFTTKRQGEGTGLGLSMAKGFAEQSGGGLLIESSVGTGSAVALVLPIANAAPEEREERTDDPQQPLILLVDDDALVRNVLQEQLELAGYRVVPAGDGTDAIAAFEAEGADLLLTDFAMPGIDGVTLITRLQDRVSTLPAILITGYAADNAGITKDGPYRLLHKPVNSTRLQAEVAECLRARVRAAP